jgi:hypothetical protein
MEGGMDGCVFWGYLGHRGMEEDVDTVPVCETYGPVICLCGQQRD